jgi:hypothetical protein
MKKNVLEVFASAARTATPTGVVFYTGNAPALYVIVEVTAAADTPSVVFNIDLWDPVSGTGVTLLDSAAVTAVSSNIYKISPALAASANLIAQEHVPPHVKISPVHADTDSITYSVSAILL